MVELTPRSKTTESDGVTAQQRVTDLRQQLKQAEVEVALDEAAVTMQTVAPAADSNVPLGPVPTMEVDLEGSTVKALINTGSPVTIISLKF